MSLHTPPTKEHSISDTVTISTRTHPLTHSHPRIGMVKQSLIDYEEMAKLLAETCEITDIPNAPSLRVSGGRVEFDHVSFGYSPDRLVLRDVSFVCEPGQTVAIVGPSGAGKSTISKLLFRMYDVTSGRILIDGQEICRVSQDSLRDSLGLVPQDTVLFNDTIAQNILFGKIGSSMDTVYEVSRSAQIHDFIMVLSILCMCSYLSL